MLWHTSIEPRRTALCGEMSESISGRPVDLHSNRPYLDRWRD
jgi:hypothetical protein